MPSPIRKHITVQHSDMNLEFTIQDNLLIRVTCADAAITAPVLTPLPPSSGHER